MNNIEFKDLTAANVEGLSLEALRTHWSAAWGMAPHNRLSRNLLTKSLLYKIREANGQGLGFEQQQKLDGLVRAYKRSRETGAKRQAEILPGTRLVRDWKGHQHIVTVQAGGFEYNGKTYRSLSAIASEIAGTRWNGWTFFGVTKPARSEAA